MTIDATDPVDYGRARDHAADEIERCRRRWQDARQAVTEARYAYERALRGQTLAELDYNRAVAIYETMK